MSGHTPGPWRAVIEQKQPQILYRGLICTIEHGDGYKAVVTDGKQETSWKNEWEANAHLIAAAPETAAERDRLKEANADLLAALEVAYELMAKVEESAVEHTLYDGRPVEEWCNQANAAIAKSKEAPQ